MSGPKDAPRPGASPWESPPQTPPGPTGLTGPAGSSAGGPAPGWNPPPPSGWAPQQQGPWNQPPPQPGPWSQPVQPGQWGPQQAPYAYGQPAWEEPRRSSRWPIVLILVLIGFLIAALVAAVVMLGSGIGALTSGTSIADVRVGQCFDGGRASPASSASVIQNIEIVDCSEPHESEMAASVAYPATGGDEYPGIEPVASYAESQCMTRFAEYVGTTFEQSIYGLTFVYPQEFNWLLGDRSIQCVVHPPDGQPTMTGSVRNSRR